MSKETTDTTGFELKPTGHYVLEVDRVIKTSIGREGGKQYPGYKWFFEIRACDHELEDNNFNIFMFKSQMGDLLRALGAVEIKKDVFEWDMEKVKGKCIESELVHVDINGNMRESLIEIKPYSDSAISSTQTEEKAWDE